MKKLLIISINITNASLSAIRETLSHPTLVAIFVLKFPHSNSFRSLPQAQRGNLNSRINLRTSTKAENERRIFNVMFSFCSTLFTIK